MKAPAIKPFTERIALGRRPPKLHAPQCLAVCFYAHGKCRLSLFGRKLCSRPETPCAVPCREYMRLCAGEIHSFIPALVYSTQLKIRTICSRNAPRRIMLCAHDNVQKMLGRFWSAARACNFHIVRMQFVLTWQREHECAATFE